MKFEQEENNVKPKRYLSWINGVDKLCNYISIDVNLLKKVRNKVSYIVKMERGGGQGGLIMNMGYITVWNMTEKVSHI